MAKRSRLFWLIIGIIIVVIIVAGAVFLNPVSNPVKTSASEDFTVLPAPSVVPPTPQKAPVCINVNNGGKVPSSVSLQEGRYI